MRTATAVVKQLLESTTSGASYATSSIHSRGKDDGNRFAGNQRSTITNFFYSYKLRGSTLREPKTPVL